MKNIKVSTLFSIHTEKKKSGVPPGQGEAKGRDPSEDLLKAVMYPLQRSGQILSLSLADNKVDLAHFLLGQHYLQAPKEILVARGFTGELM